MKVLHIAPHLGGGVGKAHSALRAVMPAEVDQTYCLLETPRDRRYADEIAACGGKIVLAENLAHVSRLAGEADVVQFEFWNHPKLYELLALTDFPAMRSVFWSHISGLFRPFIAPDILRKPHRFVFTTPASLALIEGRPDIRRFSAIGSGFGFEGASKVGQTRLSDTPIAYLGTVDFVKMSPLFFEVMDRLGLESKSSVWGAFQPDGEVAAMVLSMVHPDRVNLQGQTTDPRTALMQSNIFLYPLQPDHYGTAENALIEAMSLGLVPVVMANPAERTIVEHMQTGLIAQSLEECIDHVERVLQDHVLRERLSTQAHAAASQKYRPEISARRFVALWDDVVNFEKHEHEFASAIGKDPLSWYRSTIGSASIDSSDKHSKGTLAHFRSAFPDAECWKTL